MASAFLDESVPDMASNDPESLLVGMGPMNEGPDPREKESRPADRRTRTGTKDEAEERGNTIPKKKERMGGESGEEEEKKKKKDRGRGGGGEREKTFQSGGEDLQANDRLSHAAENGGVGVDAADEDDEEAKKSRPKVQIDPTKDLWQNIALNVKEGETDKTETNVLMVGASDAGKTTLLQRIYTTFSSSTAGGTTSRAKGGEGGSSGTSTKKMKPTTGLDYSFARRTDRHQAQVAHFWELAQGVDLSQLADVIITPENIHAMVLVVVVDASDKGIKKVWETATYWLKRLDRRVSEVLSRMRAKGSTVPDKLLDRCHKLLGGKDNPDIKRMRISGVPTVLVVNKMDAFSGDSSKVKLMVQCLRFLAHLYGAHLICTGEDESVAKWRLLISHFLFQAPFDTRHIQMDPERGNVLVMPDHESFVEIGDPPVTNFSAVQRGATSGDGELDRWGAPFDAAFPPERQNDIATEDRRQDQFMKKLYELSEDGYGEPKIDAMRRQKEEELEQYRKAMKTKERNASRKGG